MHVSELATKRVVSVDALYKVGEKVDVKLLGINEKGQLRLSRKALLEDEGAAGDVKRKVAPEGQGRRGPPSPKKPEPEAKEAAAP